MHNKRIKVNLYKMVLATLLLSIGILFIGAKVGDYLNYARYDVIENTLNTKVEAYKMQVEKQIEADVQTLYTTASFLKIDGVGDLDVLYNVLHEANKKNHFIGMFSVYKDGRGIESIINEDEASYIKVDELELEIRRIYKESLNGKDVISDVFYLDNIEANVVAISVPIYGKN